MIRWLFIGFKLLRRDYYGKAISILERSRILPSFMKLAKIALARAKLLNNEKDINLNEIFRCYEDTKIHALKSQELRYIGEIRLNVDDQHVPEAEHWIKEAIETDTRNRMMWHLGMDYALYAELFKRKGNQSKAKENLTKAIEILKECSALGWVEKYEKELAAIS